MTSADQMLTWLGYPGECNWTLTLAEPTALRQAIPAGVIGVYLMISLREFIYAGRSDSCLKSRLVTHEHLGSAGLVAWRTCNSAIAAWQLEGLWYRRIVGRPGVLNKIFPGVPHANEGLVFTLGSDAQASAWEANRRRRNNPTAG